MATGKKRNTKKSAKTVDAKKGDSENKGKSQLSTNIG